MSKAVQSGGGTPRNGPGTIKGGVAPTPISKYERTRTRILDAAAHVLSNKGYSGTRLSDVADRAAIQAPAIYYYFPSRDELIEEVMACGLAGMRANLVEALDASSTAASALDRIVVAVTAHLRHELEISDYATAFIRNASQIPEGLRRRQLEEEAEYAEIWRRLFDDAAAAGEIRAELDPRIAQLLLLGALNWTAEWWDPQRASLDSIVEAAQTLVRSALTAEVGRPGLDESADEVG